MFDRHQEKPASPTGSEYAHEHPDIERARSIEPFFPLFRLFNMTNPELIRVSLAAVYTLARLTGGLFTRDDMDCYLSHLDRKVRVRVIRALEAHGWIISNGISYEIPERAKTLLVFMFGALVRPELGYAQDIRVAFAMMDLDEVAATDDETASRNFDVAIHTLKQIRSHLERALDQRSSAEAKKMLQRSDHIRQAIADVRRRLRDRNRIYYRYNATTEALTLCSEIEALYSDLLLFIHSDVQAHARSFGQYLSPEQLDEFLQKADVGLLASLARRRFASPRSPFFLPKEDILRRGIAFLQQEPEFVEPTTDPPQADVERRDVVVHRQEGPAQAYYRELMVRLRREGALSLADAVLQETWGATLFRTGLLVGAHRDLADQPKSVGFDLELSGTLVHLSTGPVSQMTDGRVALGPGGSQLEEVDAGGSGYR